MVVDPENRNEMRSSLTGSFFKDSNKMKFSLAFLGFSLAHFVSAQELEDIPTTAVNAGSFTTLVAALEAAGLVDTLSAPNGPYTVFAPTDDAFAAIPAALVSCLLLPDNIDALTSILTYHVVEGAVLSTDLEEGTVETLSTELISISLADGVTINDATTVITADIETSNGVIHVIDSGMLLIFFLCLFASSIITPACFSTCPPKPRRERILGNLLFLGNERTN